MLCDFQHAPYSVYRSFDVVAHPSQEIGLCNIGALRLINGTAESVLIFDFFLFVF